MNVYGCWMTGLYEERGWEINDKVLRLGGKGSLHYAAVLYDR